MTSSDTKADGRGSADQFVVVGIRLRRHQGKYRCAVRRRNSDPALSRLKAHVEGQIETKLIYIESQTAILIANEHVDRVNPEIGVFATLAVAITISRPRGSVG